MSLAAECNLSTCGRREQSYRWRDRFNHGTITPIDGCSKRFVTTPCGCWRVELEPRIGECPQRENLAGKCDRSVSSIAWTYGREVTDIGRTCRTGDDHASRILDPNRNTIGPSVRVNSCGIERTVIGIDFRRRKCSKRSSSCDGPCTRCVIPPKNFIGVGCIRDQTIDGSGQWRSRSPRAFLPGDGRESHNGRRNRYREVRY